MQHCADDPPRVRVKHRIIGRKQLFAAAEGLALMDDTPSSQELFLFLASTAHDMKNSISVLSGTLETLLADGPGQPDGPVAATPSASAYPQMAHMLYQTRRLNDNLIQLLALYKQVGKPEYPFDVQPLEMGSLMEQVVAAARVLLASRGITLVTDFDPALIWHFDEDLIIGVVGHAINNAVNYTRDTIRVAISIVDEYLQIRVEDNGAGYPEAMLDAGVSAMQGNRTGVNFLTNSTGLGLYFSSEVAKMHRHRGRSGSLRLENGGSGGGGCFVLSLP
jgi:signal transduction histidine kinase